MQIMIILGATLLAGKVKPALGTLVCLWRSMWRAPGILKCSFLEMARGIL